MTLHTRQAAAAALLAGLSLLFAACTTLQGEPDEGEAPFVSTEAPGPQEPESPEQEEAAPEVQATEGEVPLSVAESEPPEVSAPEIELDAIIVTFRREEQIRDLVSQARELLEDYELEYVFTGKKKNETLRGRPVAFALWSEESQEWTVARLEIPRPPVSWKPGGKPLKFTPLTPGIQAQHIKGTGAERLMFAFSRDGEPLKVYGRKFPVFDAALVKKKRWRAVAETAKPIVYLPFTEDTFDPDFVSGGRDFLLSTAQQAIDELRLAKAPSVAFPGEALADVVPASVISTLAVIEQTDDADFVAKGEEAFNEVLNQYGLKRGEAYRYSVSSAAAIGPMQFTNRRGNGTYSLVVRRCPAARLEPNFERGATDLLNAMKAAICLFDIELKQMRPEIRAAYRDNREVLGIFPVAAYNGGPRNVTKLASVLKRMKVGLTELGRPGEQPAKPVPCPCVWKAVASDVIPVTIPRYNNENRWYIEKYQSILSAFEEGEPPGKAASFASTDAADPLPLARGDRQRPRAQLGARAERRHQPEARDAADLPGTAARGAGRARFPVAPAGRGPDGPVDLQPLEGRPAPARHLSACHAGRVPEARACLANRARHRRAREARGDALGLPRHGLPASGIQEVPAVALAGRR